MKILITGAMGFIGSHVSRTLLKSVDVDVVGIDISYAVSTNKKYQYYSLNISNWEKIHSLFSVNQFDCVIHLAAQAGVRDSSDKIKQYVDSNLVGFVNILEACKKFGVEHLIYASSSSVYGEVAAGPSWEGDNTDHPLSFYAATKKANEILAYTYSDKFLATALRFFTVYGPYGRPDMAIYKFTKSILEGTPIKLFGNGEMTRDFTYIDDVVDVILRLVGGASVAPSHRVLNVGNGCPINLYQVIGVLEGLLGKRADIEQYPIQEGEVLHTNCESRKLDLIYPDRVKTSLIKGLSNFVDWYLEYYKIKK